MLRSIRLPALRAFLAVAVVFAWQRPVPTQHLIRSANIEVWARVARSDYPTAPHVYRLYEESQELEVDVGMGHRSFDIATADRKAFSEGLRVELDWQGRSIPVRLDSTFLPSGDSSFVQLSLEREVGWKLRVQRRDSARFSTGVYTFRLSVAEAIARLRLPDRTAPRSLTTELALTVHVLPPRNQTERVQMYRVLAQRASLDRRLVDAALLAKRALELSPNDLAASQTLAGAYLGLDRCREAAVVLQSIPQSAFGGRSGVPQMLEFAYVCDGDEANATRVMRLRGVRPEQIESTLEETRQRVRKALEKRLTP